MSYLGHSISRVLQGNRKSHLQEIITRSSTVKKLFQSDTFAQGERAESPVGVGEKLSREGSPIEQVEVKVPDKLEPGTPERSRPGSVEGDKEPVHLTTFDEGEEDEEDDEEDDQPEFDREELIERYHVSLTLVQHPHLPLIFFFSYPTHCSLTLSKTTNFRPFQTERVHRHQF